MVLGEIYKKKKSGDASERGITMDRIESDTKKISVTIIAQNEQSRIRKAIESCKGFADEIVVVDGGSTDATREIAESLGCKVYLNPWPGYAEQRNFAATHAEHDWIFFIDTDEFVDSELNGSLLNWKKGAASEADVYNVYRIGNFMGIWLSRGEYLTRLYNKRKTKIRVTPVHEGPETEGLKVDSLPGVLWHDGYRSIADHVNRFNRYTELEAEKAVSSNKNFSLLRLLTRPILRFGQKYVLQGLFRKGLAGLTIAMLWAYYEYLCQIKLYELIRVQKTGHVEQKAG